MGSRYVSIWFPELLTDWHCIDDPSLKNKPFAVRTQSHNRMIVKAANKVAKNAGIRSGMVVADARALEPALILIDEKKDLAERLLQKLALWAIRYTPVTAIDLPDGLILDASGCTHLWSGDENYIQHIRERLTARGYTIRMALADTIGAAWALARFSSGNQILMPGEHQSALGSLPVAALRLEPEVLDKLFKLGLRKIEHILALSIPSLIRRFGTLPAQRLHQLLGMEPEYLEPVRMPEPYTERLLTQELITTATGVRIALEHLLERMCTRLQKESKGLRSCLFKAYQVSGGLAQIAIETTGPAAHSVHLLKLFELKLPMMSAGEGIELFVLEAKHIEQVCNAQERIWEAPAGINDRQVHELLDRIATKVGKENISRYLPAAHYIPEKAFRKASSLTEKSDVDWKPDKPRPIFFLAPPEPIEVTAPIPDYPPMLFRYRGKLHKIVRADGPERIEQEWWASEGEHRDYYYVENEEGKRYWLFRLGHYQADAQPQWFIHGFFA